MAGTSPYNFGDLTTAAGVTALNDHFASHSYAVGFYPTKDDKILSSELIAAPDAQMFPHASRWYRHINYFPEATVCLWPKGKYSKPASGTNKGTATAAVTPVADTKVPNSTSTTQTVATPPVVKNGDASKDEDFDLFGDDEETVAESAKALSKTRAAKKAETAAKPKKTVINRSSLVIEIEPNNVDTDLEHVKDLVLGIKIEGVTWGEGFKKVPLAFGLYKLQVSCTIIDDLVETDNIVESIEVLGMSEEQAAKHRELRELGDQNEEEEEEAEDEKLVQAVSIVSFNKL